MGHRLSFYRSTRLRRRTPNQALERDALSSAGRGRQLRAGPDRSEAMDCGEVFSCEEHPRLIRSLHENDPFHPAPRSHFRLNYDPLARDRSFAGRSLPDGNRAPPAPGVALLWEERKRKGVHKVECSCCVYKPGTDPPGAKQNTHETSHCTQSTPQIPGASFTDALRSYATWH